MNLISYESDSSDDGIETKVKVNPAPEVPNQQLLKTNKDAPSIINANLPVEQQRLELDPKKDLRVEELSMTDAIWQDIHYKKQGKKRHHKHKREIPWDETEQPKPIVPISDRIQYQQRQSERSWCPAIGEQEMKDTYIWHNTITITDRLGRSWVHPPLSMGHPDPNHSCFLPKANVHTFAYHTSDVTDVEMFPIYGHMILTASLDSTVRIWSLFGDRACIQTYIGHTNGVRDISFEHDGFRFSSCCYGRLLKLWDTDKGNRIVGYMLESVPTQMEMNLDQNSGETAIISLENGKVAYYDFKSSGDKPVTMFQGHNGPVSAITWLQNYQHFVSAGEDDQIIMWDIRKSDEPVNVLKNQYLNKIRALTVHPTESCIAAQVRGGEIVTIDSKTLRLQTKSFVGHKTDTFPCRMSISPDGSFITSGDANGSAWIWNWNTTKLEKTFNCHTGVVAKTQWSPFNPSQIVTASYDNTLCLLD